MSGPAPLEFSRTARQIMAAAPYALYICADTMSMMEDAWLARELGRKDIRLMAAWRLVNPKLLSCIRPRQLVIDHKTPKTDTVLAAIRYAEVHRIPVDKGE